MSTLSLDELPSLEAIRAERARRIYARDPVRFVRERLGEHPWSKQRTILESVRDHRRTAVQSSHDIGKSFIAARAAVWWLQNHPVGEAFVVTSAPTGDQVKAILWREIGRAHGKANAHGRLNQTEWWSTPINGGKEEIIAFGRKPAEFNPSAFQGIHARYVLVIFDEACGIPESLWEAARGLVTNDESRFLAIGNPTDPQSHFAKVCLPGSGWNVIRISAFDTPAFTGEEVPPEVLPVLVGRQWVEEARLDWAPTWQWTPDGGTVVPPAGVVREESASPMWFSRVLGEFPVHASDALIPMTWIQQAMDREVTLAATDLHELGVDVGGGNDRSTIAERMGALARIIKRTQTPDTMQTAGHVLEALRETGASLAKVDPIGIGKGAVDRLRELKARAVGVDVRGKPRDKNRFHNLRAELYWGLRLRFQQGEIAIDGRNPMNKALLGQLAALKYKTNSNGQLLIESKDEMRARGLPSPDDADAVMLAFAHTGQQVGHLLGMGRKAPTGSEGHDGYR